MALYIADRDTFSGTANGVRTNSSITVKDDDSADEFTVCAWVRTPSVLETSDTYILCNQEDGGDTGRTWLGVKYTGSKWILTSFVGGANRDGTISIQPDTLYHFMSSFTVTGNGGSKVYRQYVNGVQDYSSGGVSVEDNTANWVIGKHKSTDATCWEGHIYDFRLYRRFFFEDQAKALVSAYGNIGIADNLILWYRFMEKRHGETVGTVIDLSASKINGTGVGGIVYAEDDIGAYQRKKVY
jgi:hypothetical protein